MQNISIFHMDIAIGKKSFNRLRKIKTYSKSASSDDRLINAALLSTEKDYVSNIELQTAIDTFKK